MQMKVVSQAGDSHNKNKIWKNFNILNMEKKRTLYAPSFSAIGRNTKSCFPLSCVFWETGQCLQTQSYPNKKCYKIVRFHQYQTHHLIELYLNAITWIYCLPFKHFLCSYLYWLVLSPTTSFQVVLLFAHYFSNREIVQLKTHYLTFIMVAECSSFQLI